LDGPKERIPAREARRIRRESFGKRIPLDAGLLEILSGSQGHDFLLNPAGQNVYLYLVEFVKALSQAWFGKEFGSIDLLDWGAGKGQVSFLLRRVGGLPVSCDVERGASDSSFGPNTPILDKASIEVVPLTHESALPFGDGAFDAVLAFGVLEHVSDDLASLREIRRVLRAGGLFFCFNLPRAYAWTQNLAHLRGNYYHDRLYRWKGVRRLLEATGLQLLDGWHRQLLPKNTVRYPLYRFVEWLDQHLVHWTPLRWIATNIEFVAWKDEDRGAHG